MDFVWIFSILVYRRRHDKGLFPYVCLFVLANYAHVEQLSTFEACCGTDLYSGFCFSITCRIVLVSHHCLILANIMFVVADFDTIAVDALSGMWLHVEYFDSYQGETIRLNSLRINIGKWFAQLAYVICYICYAWTQHDCHLLLAFVNIESNHRNMVLKIVSL